jgi:hypothetical protein
VKSPTNLVPALNGSTDEFEAVLLDLVEREDELSVLSRNLTGIVPFEIVSAPGVKVDSLPERVVT